MSGGISTGRGTGKGTGKGAGVGTGRRGIERYEPIAVGGESTVVAQYIAEGPDSTEYQSEAQLEQEFIKILQGQAYEYLPIHHEAELIGNLRRQLEVLNDVTFSDNEWERFFKTCISSANDSIVDCAHRIHGDGSSQTLQRDDGTVKNIKLLDKKNIHNNRLQVINQYEVAKGEGAGGGTGSEGGAGSAGSAAGGALQANRYDVTILVNGLPLVHVELKRRGVDIREAFNQINRYQRESFWSGSGLFNYVQLFIISNGTLTKYYSNTTRQGLFKGGSGSGGSGGPGGSRASKSYEFTSWWADAENHPIKDLVGFTKTFLAKHTLLNIITKYCVLDVDNKLLVMRPYQIVATERILQRIEISTNYPKRLGSTESGGYIWHTTGSGKTLTSFKTAQLACAMPSVDKVLFVVDRKDLDYQTMREYDRFKKGAANSSSSTAVLAQQLGSGSTDTTVNKYADKIIITTIQKLSKFISANKTHPVYNKRVVLIFDECHRSQFGDMHRAIVKSFKHYNLFGFTGTPIFAANAMGGGMGGGMGSGLGTGRELQRTTEQVFGEKLHTYTIENAITDKNVLPFRIDYVNSLAMGTVENKQVSGIDTESALMDERRLRLIVEYILKNFNTKTKRQESYTHSIVENVGKVAATRNRSQIQESTRKQRVRGFNALFATASVEAAHTYYRLFQEAQAPLPSAQQLKIAMIYSYAANEAEADDLDMEVLEDAVPANAGTARDHLESAIADYNQYFGTSYDTSAEKFQNYYKDLSLRMKNREVDLVIVVNMFLTGFDATTLNTLFVDKNLRDHGLLQAYSRTNRILNSVKAYGNVVCFRDLEKATNDAIALFGNKDSQGIVLLKPYAVYREEYARLVGELLEKFPLGREIVGEDAQKQFIGLFGAILRLENILTSFDEFADDALLTERESQDYRSIYLDLYQEFRTQKAGDKESIADDVVFEIELVKHVEINVAYILMLVEQYKAAQAGRLGSLGADGADAEGAEGADAEGAGAEIQAQITRAISASPTLHDKRDLVEAFLSRVTMDTSVGDQWEQYINQKMNEELHALIVEENLRQPQAQEFMESTLQAGRLTTSGTAITDVLPRMSRFAKNNPAGGHTENKRRVLDKLQSFLERFQPLVAGSISSENPGPLFARDFDLAYPPGTVTFVSPVPPTPHSAAGAAAGAAAGDNQELLTKGGR